MAVRKSRISCWEVRLVLSLRISIGSLGSWNGSHFSYPVFIICRWPRFPMASKMAFFLSSISAGEKCVSPIFLHSKKFIVKQGNHRHGYRDKQFMHPDVG